MSKKRMTMANPAWLLKEPVVAEEPAVVAVRESERRPAPEEWLSFVGVAPEPRKFVVGRTASGKIYRSEVSEPEEQNEQNS